MLFNFFRKPARDQYVIKELPMPENQGLLLDKLDILTAAVSKDGFNPNEVHHKALDNLVNVNSLFTIAVFLGLSVASRNQQPLEDRSECAADPGVAKRLVIYEVVSFGCFLLSSLVAKSIKAYLYVFTNAHFGKGSILRYLRALTFMVAVLASITGVLFLTLSMVHVVQIKIGKLSCGSSHALTAVVSLCVLVVIGLLIYLPSMVFVMVYCIRKTGKS
ncbi:hypothetical protein K2173_000565 [Erythroxylum novogranatense]|uniref:PGG domain-containing protein n=1 Tax=Erythroxylum novogranatense TaxID=1862640 RepID=A0AAV8S7R1_9ROSI|nr:hypothetical protein K2173_000565 [Erythroxylum novogranatense]